MTRLTRSPSLPPLPPSLLRLEDVAYWLSISRSMAHKLGANGTLPIVRIEGSVRFRREDVQAYIDARTESQP